MLERVEDCGIVMSTRGLWMFVVMERRKRRREEEEEEVKSVRKSYLKFNCWQDAYLEKAHLLGGIWARFEGRCLA